MSAAGALVELSIGTPSTTISGWPVPLSVRAPRIRMTAEAPGSPACDCTSTLGAFPARAATMFISLLRWMSDESTLLRTLPSFSAADTVPAPVITTSPSCSGLAASTKSCVTRPEVSVISALWAL